ncbi:hypothetical protein LXL04_029944 [Taraxacum kok-saghyz]
MVIRDHASNPFNTVSIGKTHINIYPITASIHRFIKPFANKQFTSSHFDREIRSPHRSIISTGFIDVSQSLKFSSQGSMLLLMWVEQQKRGSRQQAIAVQRHATEVIGLFMKNMKQRLLPLIFYMRWRLVRRMLLMEKEKELKKESVRKRNPIPYAVWLAGKGIGINSISRRQNPTSINITLRIMLIQRMEVMTQKKERGSSAVDCGGREALVVEVTKEFSHRLAPLNMFVKELTDDMQLSKIEVEETQVFLNVLLTTSEYNELPVRHNEENYNEALSAKVPYWVDKNCLDYPHLMSSMSNAVTKSENRRFYQIVYNRIFIRKIKPEFLPFISTSLYPLQTET